MTWILVRDGIIVNHIEYDGVSEYTPPEDEQLIDYNGVFNVGWTWDGTQAVEPPLPPAPVEVPPVEPTPHEKLAAAGLSVDELKQLLGLS